MKIIWKKIFDCENYCISNIGLIKNIKTNRILKQHPDKDGYYKVVLWNGKKRLNRSVHRLLALAFIHNPKNKNQVNHIDGNKQNNNLSNLEWVTNSENQIHAYKNCLKFGRKGTKHHNNKLSEKDIKSILIMINKGFKHIEIAKKFNIHKGTVSKIKLGTRWSHVI